MTAGRTPAIEEVGFQEDLTVGDRDHIGRDVGGNVAGLRLDDRQRRQRATAERVVHAGRALQQAGVQVEDVARIGFAARRAADQQRNLAVRPGVLGQVVVDDQRVAAGLHELFAHGAAGEGRDVLQRGRVGRRGDDDDRVLHRAVLLENAAPTWATWACFWPIAT